MPVYRVTLGRDVETDQEITIGDMERRSGLYILGIQGSGKTTLMKSLILQDIENNHGVFFLDPHGDAIDDLLPRIPPKRRDDVIILNPAEETHTFGINLLECHNPTSLTERNRTYSQAIEIFTKLFADPQKEELDILLSQYLPNCFFPLIVNQGYTLCEIPLFLEDKQFRDQLLDNPDVPYEVVRFWHNTFDRLPPKDQREETASTLRRLNRFLTYEYTKHIIGQTLTTLDFTKIMDSGKILFVKLTDALPRDVWRIIGTMLVSNLVRAVFDREKQPEADRRHFCIFVDEFEKFASSDDFAVLFTQARKYAVATTIAHQERYGQFADNKRIAGATLTAVHKVFLQLISPDAREVAPEFAKESPTETRQERHLGISQEPFADLLRGHKHQDILGFVNKYLRPLQHRLEDTKEDIEGERLLRLALLDEAALSRVDERYEAMHASMARGRAIPISTEALHNTEQVLMQAQEQTERLIRLHDIARGLRLSIRSLNTFLTAIMEGRLKPEPGNELYSHFLLAFVPKFVSVSGQAAPLVELYISLRYGNPHLPRAIPMSLAAKYLGVSHEELYREAEAQYTRHVQAYVDRVHREAEGERLPQRQDEYERVLAHVMTWKLEMRDDGAAPDDKTRVLFHLLQYRQVRTLLAPYFFATYAPPWNYKGGLPSRDEGEGVAEFIRQYGEGACVTLQLLYIACTGWGIHSANWRATKDAPLNRVHTYPNLHMLEIPAITGKEPLVVWQLITKLAATLDDLGVFAKTTQLLYDLGLLSKTTHLFWSGRPTLDQSSPVRADVLLLREVLQKRAENALPATWWGSLDEQAQKYLIYRACDLVAYGDLVADRTFPQPTLPGATPLQVSAIVTALMVLLMEAQGKAKVSRDQEWERYKEELVQRSLWTYDGILHLHVYQAEGRVHMRHTVERYLPGRILTPQERKTLIDACLTELPHRESVLSTLTDFDKFCQLLRQPENHILSATTVYADREVNTYTAAEMTNQVARELLNLPPRTAYAKVVSLAPGSTSVWKGKIQTLALEETRASVGDISRLALRHAIAHGILKLRSDIDKEIRERQENWRRRGGNEPPPPTSTGGSTPPALPSGGTQSPPPPTSYIPEKEPEEKPPQARNGVTRERSQIIDQPRSSPEKKPAQKPSPAGSAGTAKNRRDATGEGREQLLRVSLPHIGDSIEKVSYEIQGRYFNLIINLNGRFLFSEEHIVFTTGPHLPVLDENHIRDIDQSSAKTKRKIVLAIPYKRNSIQKVNHAISGNYLHIILSGSIASYFDKSKVKFRH